MKDPGPRIGFLSRRGGALDYGRRLSRLRWRQRFPGRPCEDIEPDGEATRAFAASETWVLVREETAVPAPGARPEPPAGRVAVARSLSPGAAPFIHTLRELEETPRPRDEEALLGSGSPPALSFSVEDFPPRARETVAGYVERLLSSSTPPVFAPGFAAVSFEEGPRGVSAERREVISLLPPAVARLLDVGCGSGVAGAAFRRACPAVDVTGIEREPAAARQARSRLDRVMEGEAIASLAELARAGERFDGFLFADVLEHLDDPIAALALARELATADASLVASVPNVGHLSLVRDLLLGRFDPLPAGLADVGHLRWFTRDSLGDALEEAGWRTVSIDPFAGAPPPDPEPFTDFVAGWPGADAASLGAYQWLAVARPR